MAELGDKIEELTNNVKEYVDIRYRIAMLKVTGIISSVAAKIISVFIIALLAFLFVIFISVTAGFYFSELFGSREKGFLTVAAIYLVVTLILLVFKEKLVINPIRNGIIKEITKEDE